MCSQSIAGIARQFPRIGQRHAAAGAVGGHAVTEGETEEDDVVITATVPDSMELRWWLLSFGDEVEVLGPPALRAWFCEVAGNLAGYYNND